MTNGDLITYGGCAFVGALCALSKSIADRDTTPQIVTETIIGACLSVGFIEYTGLNASPMQGLGVSACIGSSSSVIISKVQEVLPEFITALLKRK